MRVKKYNKKYQEFDKSKIENSIKMAAEAIKEDIPEFMIKRIAQYVEDDLIKSEVKTIDVDKLSTLVENKLMQSSYKNTAWSYITYHYDRQKEHVYNSDLIKSFKKKLSGVNIENANANCDERSFSGRMNEAARVLLKDDALNMMSKTARNNHMNNKTYTHDLDSYSAGQHNCFERNTKLITSEGIKSFKDFIDGEEITVLTCDGEWRKAKVFNYGLDKTQKVELGYYEPNTNDLIMNTVTLSCTKDHRWYLKDGSVTTDLKVDDQLLPLPMMKDFNNIKIDTKEEAEMWCLGFVISKGHVNNDYIQVILNDIQSKYVEIFEKANYSTDNTAIDGYACSKKSSISIQQFLTDKLWKILPTKQKKLVFDGYIHANGNFDKYKEYASSCSTTDDRILEFITDLSCLCGYHILRVDFNTHYTDFKNNIKSYNIIFTVKQENIGYWVVNSITPDNNDNNKIVWCVEEPVTHTFTLAGGIITGNCLSIPFDPLLNNGVAIKQTDIRQPRSISTAFQLIAVFKQIQSLQQFGGVSATHIDWTLVPYLRITFFKHLRDGKKYLKNVEWKIPDNCEYISIDNYKDDDCYKYAIDMTIRDTRQGAEGLIHNLNSLQSRSGQQLPFSSINFGTCTLTEGRIIINAILDAELDGTGPLHKTPIFPCSIFQYDKNINGKPGTPNYDLFRKALLCTSKRLYPNYCNCNWSVNVNGTKLDIEHKRKVLSKLSESDMAKLVEWCNENTIEAANYRMIVSNNKVVIDENMIIPVEIMSTMGKCKLQLM